MPVSLMPDKETIRLALSCRCPRCRKGDLYKPGFLNLSLNERCASCDLDLSSNDSGDGPMVFLIFILGFLFVPLALLIEVIFSPPLWVHAVIAGILGLGMIFASLRPLKAYIIALQFKHRPGDWQP